MGQIARKFEAVEDGGPIALTEHIEPPLGHHEKWISIGDLMALSGIKVSMAKKALAAKRWRGADLLVRQIEIGRGGAGGMAPQVHVDSLPADLREAWYLEHGIVLHEKVLPENGQSIMVPELEHETDLQFEADLALARWRHEVIRPILKTKAQTPERSAMIADVAAATRVTPNGKRKNLTKPTIYNWLRDFEAEGLNGLIRKRRADTGIKRQKVTRNWDAFFEAHIDATAHAEVSEELTTYIRSLWAAGERGWRSITEKSTTRLIEISRGLNVLAFEALELGRCGDTKANGTQFGVCCVTRRRVEREREYKLLAIKDKDNAVFQDNYMPSIRRDYSSLLPRQIVVGDVHPVDIVMRREDGTVVYPKAIAWYDVATNEIHMTFVLCEPGEGIRREHVAQSFEAMVDEWGLPELLYLDNGSEYSWDAMIGGFTQLSKLTKGGMKVFDLEGDAEVHKRVMNGREAVVRSMPYNAKGKPGIEGAFGNIEQVFFATISGWTAGDRMNKKTHAKGKDPVAFSEEITRMPDRGRVSHTPRRGKVFRRQIAEKRKHVALLSLTEETERHIAHMPDAPEAPVAAIVDAGIIDRMARMQGESRKALLDEAENKKPKGPVEQWKTGPNEVLAGFQFAEDEE